MKQKIGVVAETVNPCLDCDSDLMIVAMYELADELAAKAIAARKAQQARRPDLPALGNHAERLHKQREEAIWNYATGKCTGFTERTTAYMTDAKDLEGVPVIEGAYLSDLQLHRVEETNTFCGKSEGLFKLGITPDLLKPVLFRVMGMPEQD